MIHVRRRSWQTGRKRRRGVAALEFALILPVLLVMVVGLFEVGQLVRLRQVLDNAVREGARQASFGKKTVSVPDPNNPTLGTIKETVEAYLVQERINVNGLQIKVTGPGGGAEIDPRTLNSSLNQTTPDRFRIEVTLPYERTGSQGNRLVSLKLRLINTQSLTSYAEWFSLKDFPLLKDQLAAPIE